MILANLEVTRTETRSLSEAPGAFIELPDAAIHYQRVGNPRGPTLVLVHGFGVEGGAEFAGLAGELEESFDLVIIDMVGFGYSERPTGPGPLLTHQGRAAMLSAVATQLGIERATWVGASYGGGVIAELALGAPSLVDRLVIIDGQLSNLGGGVFQTIGAAPLGIGRSASYLALTGGPVATANARASCEAGCPIRGDLDYRSEVVRLAGTTDGFVFMSRTELATSLPDSLARLSHPTLVIWGEDDQLIPLEVGRELTAAIPTATLQVIAGAGHSPQVDDPVAVAGAIQTFVRG